MKILISSLIRGMSNMEEVAREVDSWKESDIGVEIIAFTHDAGYWQRMVSLLQQLSCPLSFHGPYIKTEGTAEDGSLEQDFLFTSYAQVIALAKQFHVSHIVYHMTQQTFESSKEIDDLRLQAMKNSCAVQKLGQADGVPVLIENLPCLKTRVPLFNNQQYFDYFSNDPMAQSIIDIGHANMMGLDLEQFLVTHGARVKAYHFHNNNGVLDEHNDIFHGTFDFDAFAPLFKEYTPNANIVLEYEPHVKLSWQEVKDQVRYLQKKYK